MSDVFLEKGRYRLHARRNAEETQRFNARTGDLTKGKPIIVLDHGGSASASDIVAARCRITSAAPCSVRVPSVRARCADHHPSRPGSGALRITTARYYTPAGKSIQAKGISPDIEVLQDVPDEMKAKAEPKGESSLRGHLKADGEEQTGSQSYIPPDPKDDKALHMALDLLRGSKQNAAFPPKRASLPN